MISRITPKAVACILMGIGIPALLSACSRPGRPQEVSAPPGPGPMWTGEIRGEPGTPADRAWLARHWSHCLSGSVRDPFAPEGPEGVGLNSASGANPTTMNLSAIWCQLGTRLAVINGRPVTEGDRWPPFRVERITANAAVLSSPTGRLTLMLNFCPERPGTAAPPDAPARPSPSPSRKSP